MSWSSRPLGLVLSSAFLLALTACTVEPLATARSDSALVAGQGGTMVSATLRQIAISDVSDRTAQRVRNALLFALHGGTPPFEPRYLLALGVTSSAQVLQVRGSSLAPTASRLTMRTSYQVSDTSNGRIVASGLETTTSAFDRTSQSFANNRAQRDAEQRAAEAAAQKIRLALSRKFAGQ